MRLAAFAVLGLSTALGACAPTAAGDGGNEAFPARQCFSAHEVRNFRQGGPGQILIRVGRDRIYELNAAGGCTDLDFAYRMAIVPDSLAGSRLCTGEFARVQVPGSTAPSSVCRVRISRQLTAEDVAALPASSVP